MRKKNPRPEFIHTVFGVKIKSPRNLVDEKKPKKPRKEQKRIIIRSIHEEFMMMPSFFPLSNIILKSSTNYKSKKNFFLQFFVKCSTT